MHSCTEAIQSLEQQAARVADMIQNSLDPEGMMPPQLDGILLILDEYAYRVKLQAENLISI